MAAGLAAAGGILVYAGLRGESPLDSLRSFLSGSPPPIPKGTPVVLESPLGGGDFGTSGGLPALVQAAQRYLGVRYRWGGKDPATGLDCSGLVYVAFRDIGVTAPRSTWTQVSWKMVRKTGTPSAGDLVWWPGHIGIVVDGKRMINAPHTGAVVRYDSVGVRNGIAPTFLHYTGAGGTLAETTRVPGQAQP